MKFGKRSMKNLYLLSYNLQWVMREALAMELMDFSVICTHRSRGDQDQAFMDGKSKVRWPNSKHNSMPSKAVDCVPYVNGKISWNAMHCCCLAFMILTVAKKIGINIRWGGNWDMDYEPITDQDFNDLCHFEEV